MILLARSARFRTYRKDLTTMSTYLTKSPIYIETGAEKGTLHSSHALSSYSVRLHLTDGHACL